MLEVLNFLKKYNCYIYTGNQEMDLTLIEEELKALKENGLIEDEQYLNFSLIIRKRKRELKKQ